MLIVFWRINLICYVFFSAYFVDNIKCHFGASMISGLVTTLASMPVDITKTRFAFLIIILFLIFILYDMAITSSLQ